MFVTIPIALYAQRNQSLVGETSIDITAGPSTLFLGDIGDPFMEDYLYTRNRFDQLMPANSVISVGYHQSITERWGLKISAHAGIYDRKDDNYSFRSSIFEFAGRLEYNLFINYYPRVQSLYIYTGLGFLYSNYFNERLSSRLTLADKAIAPVIPIGIGYKHEIFDRFSIGAEFDVHYSLTDMIEGKKGGLPHDALSTLSLVVSYQISDGNRRLKGCNCNW
ncbi:MAG: hypothetical protein JXR27_10520 [Paludibacteraceae bacterium]|nr:hypothetical protein [Paludibacteraceae bacterium]